MIRALFRWFVYLDIELEVAERCRRMRKVRLGE